MQKDYPQWKIVAWRFGRVFLAAVLMELAIIIPAVENLSLEQLWPALVVPALIAGLSALGKAIRLKSSDESRLHKLPL